MNSDVVLKRFEPAILRIETPSHGTGFLIDAEHGLVLTAGHVVYDSAGAINGNVVARSKEFAGPKTLLRIGHLLEQGIDLALLRLDTPDALRHVIALDIGADTPRKNTQVTVLGYKGLEDFQDSDVGIQGSRVTRGKQSFEYGSFVIRGVLELESDTFPGASGSPVIGPDGLAIGAIVVDDQGRSSLFTSMAKIGRILADADPSDDLGGLDPKLRDGTVDARLLTRRLKPNYADSFRNIELIRWGVRVAADRDAYRQARPFFDCPIEEAFADRALKVIAEGFVDLATTAARAQTSVEAAQVELLLNRREAARARFEEASKLANSVISNPDRRNDLASLAAAFSVDFLASQGLERSAASGDDGSIELLPDEETVRALARGSCDQAVIGPKFAFDSHEVPKSEASSLNRVVYTLHECPEQVVLLAGFTDAVGDVRYNAALSSQRANAVKTYLVESGISADRIIARGLGESRLENTASAMMRSVHIRIGIEPGEAAAEAAELRHEAAEERM